MANFCPTVEDICVSRGDSPVMSVQVSDPDGGAVDITGYSFVLTVDTQPFPPDNVTNVFSQSIGPIVDGSSGIVQFQPSTINTNQTPSIYFYDIQMTTTTPSVRTLLRGQFEIQQDVSKV